MKGRVVRDGTIEVWIDGWHLSFPADGGKPSAARGTAPADATETIAGVTIDRGSSKPGVRVGDWIVWLDDSEPTPVRVKPRADSHRRYYKR
jgi:hypothetical protein